MSSASRVVRRRLARGAGREEIPRLRRKPALHRQRSILQSLHQVSIAMKEERMFLGFYRGLDTSLPTPAMVLQGIKNVEASPRTARLIKAIARSGA
jgi:hypothetical protein